MAKGTSICIEGKHGYDVVALNTCGSVEAVYHVFLPGETNGDKRQRWNLSATYVMPRGLDVDDSEARSGAWW